MFVLKGLRGGAQPLQLELYSVNERGQSDRIIITDVAVNRPEKHTDSCNYFC